MSTNDEATLTFHGSTFVELSCKQATSQTTVFIDPVFSSSRRGRRLRGDTRPCDYVLVTQEGDNFDDVLDLLEDCEATLVGDPRVCRAAHAELKLGRGRTLDLEAYERASDDCFKLTAVPIFAASLLDDGLGLLEELTDMSPLARILPRDVRRAPRAGAQLGLRSVEALGALPFIGNGLMRNLRGKPALGYLFDLAQGQKVLHLANGVHGATDERDLEDIASLGAPDVLLIDVGNQGVEPVVRAVRVFAPQTVLLYRSHDPYARGRRAMAQAQPIKAYLEAIDEDQGDEVEALHLREGDRYVLASQPTKANGEVKPAASTSTSTSASTAAASASAAAKPAAAKALSDRRRRARPPPGRPGTLSR